MFITRTVTLTFTVAFELKFDRVTLEVELNKLIFVAFVAFEPGNVEFTFVTVKFKENY